MPEKNDLITFAIPTYGRANFIDELLSYMFNELELFDYPIWIVDNCSPDNTREIVEKYAGKYPNLVYHRHEKNIGADLNALYIQDNFETKYLWLIGDSVRLYKKELYEILDILNKNNYDALIVNYFNRIKNIESCNYADRNNLLKDLGWHTTQYSAVISSKEAYRTSLPLILSQDSSFNFYYRFFDHLGRKSQIDVYWYSFNSLSFSDIQKTDSWHNKMVPIWIKNFPETVLSLPISYSLASKLYCLKSYGKTHYLFSLYTVMLFTVKGFYLPGDVIKYKDHFKLIMPLNWRIYYLIFHTPKPVLKAVISLYNVLVKVKKGLSGSNKSS